MLNLVFALSKVIEMNDDNSIFYNHEYGRRFTVSLMALEFYATNSIAEDTEEGMYDVLMTTLTACCKVTAPTEEDVDYFLDRMSEIKKDMENQKPNEGGPSKPKKSFGTSYLDYLNGLSVDSTLMKMVGYNIEQARKLYCEVDRQDTLKLVREYVKGLLEGNTVAMEAAMYGFGGSYKDDGGGEPSNVKTYETQSASGIAKLKELGF